MHGEIEDGHKSPRPKHKTRLWPIPPLVRIGTPKGIVNADASLNTGGSWLPASAHVDTILPRLHCTSPKLSTLPPARPSSGRVPSARPASASQVVPLQPNLLEALGMLGPAAGEVLRRWDPQECDVGCYWRWLVHALLDDVAALKRNHEETEEGFKMLAEKRQEIEDTIRSRDQLEADLVYMTGSLKELREDVPRLRRELKERQQESQELKQRHLELQDKQRELNQHIGRSMTWQKENTRKVKVVEREAGDGRRQEKSLGEQLNDIRKRVSKLVLDQQDIVVRNKMLEAEVKELEDKKAQKKAGKAKAKGKAR